MIPKDAQERLKILRFFDKHGLAATVDAFGVSRRTLYRWKRALKEAGGNPAALAAKSCAPKRRRVPKTDVRRVAEMRRLRTLYPNLGKEKLHVLLAPWCAKQGIALPSVSTIGRIISRAPDKMRLTPHRLDARGRVKPVRCARKARKPQDLKPAPLTLWAVDTIERVRDGIRRYVLTAIAPVSATAFAVALPSKHARYSARVAEALVQGLAADTSR
ncbi:helix-turn-helix domain-containing protein [Sulfuricystis multivorans]|uniref:helix-turn-helix domain-containing protein n=1 Tax=Sulfuricystis multivorans TaxID=2211108 RepID=UPI0024DFD24C|nr:helix-turn-helix domain-containing protein [Sulfuricystis multivorans]